MTSGQVWTFAFTGAQQSFVVPANTYRLLQKVWAAQGGGTNGGLGGYSEGYLSVTPGETIYPYVGGTAGFNGGGAGFSGGSVGGGASDVRQGGTALANRKIVAGGGGGWSGYASGPGGHGGGLSGIAGGGPNTAWGTPGTQTAGGNNGGGLGSGGAGVAVVAGGGGGGYYGGGGGNNGGGGGGSGYIGGVTLGSMQTGVRSGNGLITFTDNTTPNSPTLVTPTSAQVIDRGVVNRFSHLFSDPDPGDTQSAFDVRYRIVGNPTWINVYEQTPNQFWDAPAGTFVDANYEWQARSYDNSGGGASAVSPYCASGFFTAQTAPVGATITAPTNGSQVASSITLTWSVPNQTSYQVRRVADNAGAPNTSVIYEDTGTVDGAGVRSKAIVFTVNNRVEHLQVRVFYAGLWSPWASISVTVNDQPPMVPGVVLTAFPASASINVAITNPTPTGTNRATAYNDLWLDDGLGKGWERRATMLAQNSTWTYWLPVSGRDYNTHIKVIAYADNGANAEGQSLDPGDYGYGLYGVGNYGG